MARRSDPFIKVHWEAARLLQELEIDALPIDPFEIARRLDIELRPLPANSGGASGMLVHVSGQFGICYPTHVDSDGFKNFSVGHEIGHYWLPGHLDAVFDERGQHVSHAASGVPTAMSRKPTTSRRRCLCRPSCSRLRRRVQAMA